MDLTQNNDTIRSVPIPESYDSRRQPETLTPSTNPVYTPQPEPQVPFTPSQPTVPNNDVEEEGGGVPVVLKLLVGLVIVGVIGFLVFGLLIPLFMQRNSGKVTLTYWGLWEDSNVMQPIITSFEKENPNIQINYIKQDSKQYSSRLLSRINNGTGPDIFRFHNSWMPMVQPLLVPLPSDVISKEDFTKFYYPVIQTDLVRNGAIYGLPLEVDTLALFTNNQLLQAAGVKPPTTWNDFITDARSLTVKDETGKIKTAGAALGTYANISHAPDLMSLLFIQNGADLTNLSTTSQNSSDALSFYTSFAKDNGNVWDDTLDPSLGMFIRGNLAMFFGYSYDALTVRAINPTLQFSIYPVPHLPNRSMTIASYWVEGVSNQSKHQKEALLFMKYLAQKQTQQMLFTQESKTRLFGEPYARTDLADSLKTNAFIYPFVLQAQDAQSTYFSGETYDDGLNGPVNGYLRNAIQSVLINTSPGTALDTLTKGVSSVLSKYGSK